MLRVLFRFQVKFLEIVFTPPQDPNDIQSLLTDLERFLNVDTENDADPLVKMAIAHHQFESIHPFYDGNGRAGRILNSLYLVSKNLLEQPVLYLSGYITGTKAEYYRLLQSTRDTGNWEPWLIYMLQGVSSTSRTTISLIEAVRKLMADYEQRIREALPKIYSHALLTNLFRHPYTKIEAVQDDLGVSRITASKYLSELTESGFVEKHRMGKYNYFVNRPLIRTRRVASTIHLRISRSCFRRTHCCPGNLNRSWLSMPPWVATEQTF